MSRISANDDATNNYQEAADWLLKRTNGFLAGLETLETVIITDQTTQLTAAMSGKFLIFTHAAPVVKLPPSNDADLIERGTHFYMQSLVGYLIVDGNTAIIIGKKWNVNRRSFDSIQEGGVCMMQNDFFCIRYTDNDNVYSLGDSFCFIPDGVKTVTANAAARLALGTVVIGRQIIQTDTGDLYIAVATAGATASSWRIAHTDFNTVGKAVDETARFALTGLPLGAEIPQISDGNVYKLMVVGGESSAANWKNLSTVSMLDEKTELDGADTFIGNRNGADFFCELTAIRKTMAVPIHLADGDAPSDFVYYSTTASKLVYKDLGGTVRALY